MVTSDSAGIITFMANRLEGSDFIIGLIIMTNFYSQSIIEILNESNCYIFITILLFLSAVKELKYILLIDYPLL